jgi:ribulose kinase
MQSDAPSRYVLGVDVGTQSARAGVFDGEGKQLSTAAAALALYKPEGCV